MTKTGLAEYLLSIVTAASFLGEVEDLTRYEDWHQIRKLAGYNLTITQSGDSKKGARKSPNGAGRGCGTFSTRLL